MTVVATVNGPATKKNKFTHHVTVLKDKKPAPFPMGQLHPMLLPIQPKLPHSTTVPNPQLPLSQTKTRRSTAASLVASSARTRRIKKRMLRSRNRDAEAVTHGYQRTL